MKSNYNYLVKLIKSVGSQKIKVIIITIIINLLSTSFTETLKTLEKGHGSKQKTGVYKKHTTTSAKTKEHKTRVMNNVVKLYNNYFDFYKKAYDESALDEKERLDPKQFKIVDNNLPNWLELKNDFNEAKGLINDIRIDVTKVKVTKEDRNVFNGLNKLITDINNNRVKKEYAVERLKKSISDLTRLRQKQKTVFQIR